MNSRAGTVTLTGLRARGNHGVFEFERRDGQEFVVDVVLELDMSRAITSDDIAETVNYGELANNLIEVMQGPPVHLIETLADRLLGVCLADERVLSATVTVHKPQAPIPHEFSDVAVTLQRVRETRAETEREPSR